MAAVAFALAGIGAGRWSLDNAFSFDLNGTIWALAALAAGLIGGGAAVISGRIAAQSRTAPSVVAISRR